MRLVDNDTISPIEEDNGSWGDVLATVVGLTQADILLAVDRVDGADRAMTALTQSITSLVDQIKKEWDTHTASTFGTEHRTTKDVIGLWRKDAFATATDVEAALGQANDKFITVAQMTSLVSAAIARTNRNIVKQGILPISYIGDLGYLLLGVYGSYEGASMIEAWDRMKLTIERGGTLIRLRPGTNGESIGLYYDSVAGFTSNPVTAELINTNQKYVCPQFPAGWEPVRLFGSDGDVMAGVMYQKSAYPTINSKAFVALTYGTLDGAKHDMAEILNPFFVLNDSSTQRNMSTANTYVKMIGDRIYFFQLQLVVENTQMVNGADTLPAYPIEIAIGYVNVADVKANPTVSVTPLENWNTTSYGKSRGGRNLVLNARMAGKSGSDSLCYYDGPQQLTTTLRPFNGGSWSIGTLNAAGTVLGLNIMVTLNVDSTSSTTVVSTTHAMVVDLNARTATEAYPQTPYKVTDISVPNGTVSVNLSNGGRQVADTLTGDDNTGDTHSSNLIATTKHSIVSRRTGSANNGMQFVVFSIPTMPDVETYKARPWLYPKTQIRREADATAYGTAARGNIRSPILFPGNQMAFYTMDITGNGVSTATYTPIDNDFTHTYNLLGVGAVPGFEPKAGRKDSTTKAPPREIMTEINGSSVVAHCQCLSTQTPNGPTNVTPDMVTSGSMSVSLTELTAQAQRMVSASGRNVLRFVSMLFVPRDAGIPLILRVIGYEAPDAKGSQFTFIATATCSYGGSRTAANITGFTARTDDLVVDYQDYSCFDFTWRNRHLGFISYKVDDGYLLALAGFECTVNIGPANTAWTSFFKYTTATGKISDSPHSTYGMSPYDDLLARTPFALPGKGFFITDDNGASGVNDTNFKMSGVTLPDAILARPVGTDIAKLADWGNNLGSPVVLLSQTVEQGFVVYFTQRTNLFMAGNEYIIEQTQIDLRSITADPTNKTFYVCVKLTDAGPKYTITLEEQADSIWNMQIGIIKTNATQIATIQTEKPVLIGGFYRLSPTQRGSAVPVSTGSVNTSGNMLWTQLD